MRVKRRHHTAAYKMAMLQLHLRDNTTVADVCSEHGIHPTVFHRWKAQLLDRGAIVFERKKLQVPLRSDLNEVCTHDSAANGQSTRHKMSHLAGQDWMHRLLFGRLEHADIVRRSEGQISEHDIRVFRDHISSQSKRTRNRALAVLSHIAGIRAFTIAEFL